jgi:Protein of unknown function (DUF1207)
MSAARSRAVPVPGLVVLAALCSIPAPSGAARAQGKQAPEPPAVPDGDATPPPSAPSSGAASGREARWLPSGHLYPGYVADPRRIGFGVQVLHYPKTDIPEAGDQRFDLKAGGELVLLRIQPRGRDDRGWEASLQGAFHAQFDIDRQLDNVGWDGWYGFVVAAVPLDRLSVRLGWLHDSSHVGDEYAERTGRRRIGYTRQEWIVGASWLTDRGLRLYGELGYATQMSNEELQEPTRLQAGLEWHPAKRVEGRYRGWYGAADLSSMQERDWKVDTSVQAGYRIDSGNKIWRFGIDWYNGRPPIGEFFQHTEQYIGLGMWIDI